MSANVVPFKQDLPKELKLVVTTLSDDAQNAALRKCQELGFDTTKGIISLEETLINLSSARDILLDAVDKGRLTQLPLKLQYTLFEQTQRVAQALTALVNGTDAVMNLVGSVEDLTASIWQFNLPNLSGEVLGFQSKMNQLKVQETRIREVSRQAEAFAVLRDSAQQMESQISEAATAAASQKTALQSTSDEVAGILAKVTELGQRVASMAAQVQQHEITAAQQLANSKVASADTDAIANKSKELQTEIDATRTTLQELTSTAQALLSSTQATSSAQLLESKAKYEEASAAAQSQVANMLSKIEATVTEQTTALNVKSDSTSAALHHTGAELETKTAQAISDVATRFTQAETAHESRLAEQLSDFALKAQSQLLEQSEAFSAKAGGLEEAEKKSLETGEAERAKLITELSELEGRIRESIERATGYTLFHSFQKRQLDIGKSKRFWAYALGLLVLLSLIASAAFMWSLRYVQVYNAAFYLKLSISIPLIYAIAFCNVQYSRERRLEEEYAFKSNISISLEPYQKLVGSLIDKTKPEELSKYTGFIIDSVNRVFTSPTGEIFEKPGDSNSAEKIVKACGDLIDPIIKGLKK